MGRAIDADELKTAFPCGEVVRTECVRATIDHMPTIEPEQQVMGRWIWINDKTKDNTYRLRCSLCHGRGYDEKHKYCPHCGKRMKVEG